MKCWPIPKRYILAVMCHVGFAIVYALRVNLSVAIVAMVNATDIGTAQSSDPECYRNTTSKLNQQNGELNWTEEQQGLVLGSFFYGWVVTQIPGGWMANKFGGKWVLGIAVLGTSFFTLLTPLAARTNFVFLLFTRIVAGLIQGGSIPASHELIAHWVPPEERGRFESIVYTGLHTGTIIALPISGELANSNFLGGWPSVFYVFGAIGLVWSFFWFLLISNKPTDHTTITDEEKELILSNLSVSLYDKKAPVIPWISILSSIHVWAIIVAHFSHCYVWFMVLTVLPTYFKQILGFSLSENGLLSALPFIAAFVCYMCAGVFADYLQNRWGMSIKTSKRILSILGFYPSGLFLILASYAGCDQITWSVCCLVLATGFVSFNFGAFFVNHLDISVHFSSTLMGMSNMFGALAGCISPLIVGVITKNEPTRENWRTVFAIAAAICFCGGTFFIIFMSGEKQPWDHTTHKPQTADNERVPLVNNEHVEHKPVNV